jgi:hypothetical protein
MFSRFDDFVVSSHAPSRFHLRRVKDAAGLPDFLCTWNKEEFFFVAGILECSP